jgi:transposase-like protein
MHNSKPARTNKEAKTGQIIRIEQDQLNKHLDKVVRGTVERTLNELLDAEADRLCQAGRYERSEARKDTRAGHYTRNLEIKAGKVKLKVPKLRTLTFETAIIERYRRRESSVEEALIEMYLAGISVRRVEDITQALWGTRVSPSTVSNLNKKVYSRIEKWINAPIDGNFVYVFLDGIWLKRCWAGEVKNVSVLVAIGVDSHGYRQVLGVKEGAKEDKESWVAFMRYLKSRGLAGVQMFVSDKCLGLVESLVDFYPKAKWQRCTVHFYRNVYTIVPKSKVKVVAAMLKAIHAQEDREAAETLSYYAFPSQHWRSLRTNNPLERLMREIRRRTRVVGAFPDGKSALMLVAARLRHVAGTKWGARRYINMDRLKEQQLEIA